jgi:Lon protease-like protein
MTALNTVPIFPLHAVLFPEGKLPLRIFEPRYLELVKRSLKEDQPFVIAALLSGQEVLSGAPEASAPRLAPVACLVRIVDFDALADGTLGITVVGEARVRIERSWEGPGRLMEGDLTRLEGWPELPPRADQAPLLQVLEQLLAHPAVQKLGLTVRWEAWLSCCPSRRVSSKRCSPWTIRWLCSMKWVPNLSSFEKRTAPSPHRYTQRPFTG